MRKIINTRQVGPSPEILQGFKDLLKVYSPSCVVADAQERAGVMRSYLRPLTKETRFVGPALTVRLEPGNQVDCLDALSVAQPGDVIVVDAAGETETSIWGGLMSGLVQDEGRGRGGGRRRDPRHRRDPRPGLPYPSRRPSCRAPRTPRIPAGWSRSRSTCRSSAPAW